MNAMVVSPDDYERMLTTKIILVGERAKYLGREGRKLMLKDKKYKDMWKYLRRKNNV